MSLSNKESFLYFSYKFTHGLVEMKSMRKENKFLLYGVSNFYNINLI